MVITSGITCALLSRIRCDQVAYLDGRRRHISGAVV